MTGLDEGCLFNARVRTHDRHIAAGCPCRADAFLYETVVATDKTGEHRFFSVHDFTFEKLA